MMDENHLEAVIDDGVSQDEDINISDVIEVIETDPDFKESNMYNGGGEVPQVPVQQQQQQQRRTQGKPFVKITEQPAGKALRFRYECEGRSAGSIPGASSTPENKTFPSIQVMGCRGRRAVVVVSCVTKDAPYRAHPHNLVGREGCKKGVCTLEVSPETMSVTFSNLGIQCVKKKDIENALRVREEIKVDPFMQGFSHRNQPTSIDLNAVRLCFQVFLEGDKPGKFTVPLRPEISEPIFDKKAMSDLVIVKLSDCVSYVDGGRKEIILLCEKVAKEDIQVRFFEESSDGTTLWEGFGDFQPSQVHKQTAIWFKTPRYHTLDITEPVKVSIQLRRPSDGAASESLPFELLPLDSEPGVLKRKRQKVDPNHLLRGLQEAEARQQQQQFLNIPMNIPMEGIKVEPRDKTPSPYGGQMYERLSPGGGYVPSQSVSPQYMGGPTPPPHDFLPVTVLPPFQGMLGAQDTLRWDNPSTSAAAANLQPMQPYLMMPQELAVNNNNNNLLQPLNNDILDLDSMTMRQTDGGGAHAVAAAPDITLSETLNNLSFTEDPGQQSMPDSFNQFLNSQIDQI